MYILSFVKLMNFEQACAELNKLLSLQYIIQEYDFIKVHNEYIKNYKPNFCFIERNIKLIQKEYENDDWTTQSLEKIIDHEFNGIINNQSLLSNFRNLNMYLHVFDYIKKTPKKCFHQFVMTRKNIIPLTSRDT